MPTWVSPLGWSCAKLKTKGSTMQWHTVCVCVCVCEAWQRILPGLPGGGCWCRRVFRKLKQLNFDEKPSDATLNCNWLAIAINMPAKVRQKRERESGSGRGTVSCTRMWHVATLLWANLSWQNYRRRRRRRHQTCTCLSYFMAWVQSSSVLAACGSHIGAGTAAEAGEWGQLLSW